MAPASPRLAPENGAHCRTLLTTEERFFGHDRKPDTTKEELEGLFRRVLGAEVGARCACCFPIRPRQEG